MLSLIFLLTFFVEYIRIGRFKKYDINNIRQELESASTIYYKECKVAVTDNYVVSWYNCVPMEDVVWIYIETITLGMSELMVVTKNLKRYSVGFGNNNVSVSLIHGTVGGFGGITKLEEVLEKITSKNKDILIGKTKENKKEIYRKYK